LTALKSTKAPGQLWIGTGGQYWIGANNYNYDRTHQGKMCCGRTPMETLIDGKEVWKDKITNLNN